MVVQDSQIGLQIIHYPTLCSLEWKSCKYCFLLPTLGILPNLKTVEVEWLEGMVLIVPELYGDSSCILPFRSLEISKFDNMTN